MKEFWKVFIAFIIINIFASLTFLNLDFFQYSFFINGEFQWVSLFKFILEVLICTPVFMGVYFLMENIPKWRMAAKYKAAEIERSKNL